MCNSEFVHLHCHTHFSVQDALAPPAKLVNAAKEQGFSSLAITDHGKMGGHFEFAEAAKKAGIKPILGVEFYVAKDRFGRAEPGGGRPKLNHLTVLAMNQVGYRNLLALGAEAAKPECYYYSPRIDFQCLSENHDGLIVLSGCLASELNQALIHGTYEDGLAVASKYKDVFGDRYFIELQYHGIDVQKDNLPKLVKIAKDLNIKAVASNDVHYIAPTDWKLHDVLLQMRDLREDKSGKERKNGKLEAYGSHQFYLKSYDQMSKIFGEKVPESLSNTKLIEEMVEDFYEIDRPHMLPEGKIDSENEDFKKFKATKLPHHESKEAYLAYEAFRGLKKLGLEGNPEYVKRLKYEIETIWYMGVVDYFLIQLELVNHMTERGIMCGIRGSGGGSLLNYCLGISFADPIKWGLMFERFLNPGRGNQYKIDLEDFSADELPDEDESIHWIKQKSKEFLENEENSKWASRIAREVWILENQKFAGLIKSACDSGFKLKENKSNFLTFYILGLIDYIPTGDLIISKVATLPDIDTDFDRDRRHEAFEWAQNRFGVDNVKSVGTWNTYQSKAAVLGVLKTSEKFKSQYSDNLAQMALKVSGSIPPKAAGIKEAINESPDFAYWAKKYPDEMANASKLNGVISGLGVHAAAIVISSEPIHYHVPIENSKGTMCTAFDMVNVERTGTIKYDYLGLATLTQISMTLKFIEERHDKKIDLLNIDFEDANVFKDIFYKGNTATTFQTASPGMQKSLKEIKVSNMNDLIAVIALYRPGPMQYIPDYAAGKRDPGSVKYAHPLIEKHLAPTYGIMVYQEQAMFLAREMANLSWSEVDKLRKGIAKKSESQFNEACNNFSQKALKRGIPKDAIDEVLQLMSKFGGYAFNKTHSCLYAIVAYWTAWLKYYYPSEWMASCIQTEEKKEKIYICIDECKRLGVEINSPNVNESGMAISISKDGAIYMPLTSLNGFGQSGETITLHRPYENLQDFVDRSGCNKSLYMALASGGALDCLVSPDDAVDEYFIDFWISNASAKKKTKKNVTNENNKKAKSLSLLEQREISTKPSNNNDLLNMLDDDF